ncbi:SGNH/GDSL hydrolase family protein [Streptomyces sp. SCSIO 30461]|uniref:SGNH/GDSL hydrolase family protein n=1 Tax=Streptomyces sp. SCSIO 30461 TaxID=3118085 RepID=UPI0030CC27FD
MKIQRAGYGLFAALVALALLICGTIISAVTFVNREHDGLSASRSGGGTTARAIGTGGWVGTWSAAPGKAVAAPSGAYSVRNVVRTSVGGGQARITLSNLFGTAPLRIGRASVAVAAGGALAVPGTLRETRFDGERSVEIPAGGQVVSDAARLPVPEGGHLLVTLYVTAPGPGMVTLHWRAHQTSYLAFGDRTRDADGAAYTRRISSWQYLTAVDVLGQSLRGTVVAIGDSLTDGAGSTPDTDRRWPDRLAARLRAGRWGYGVVNQGISGNRILSDGTGPSGLARFERDVLDRPGVRIVVIDLGINDIIRPPRPADARELTAALRMLAERARARGLRVVGATLMPFEGHRRYSSALEAVRQQVNDAIRGGTVFDAVLDFDRALRDPYAPERLDPAYDSGDHLHPNDAGYARMAQSVDLSVLTGDGSSARL